MSILISRKAVRVATLVCFSLLPLTRLYPLKVRILRLAGLSISRSARVISSVKFIGYGKFSLGSRSFIGHYTKVYLGVAEVVVGEDVDIGPEVSILTGSHKIGSAERIAGEGYAKNVSIGDGSWIGARSVILPGVTIGRGCMVAAGSVVINDVPDNTMVAGVPAKLVRQLGGSEI